MVCLSILTVSRKCSRSGMDSLWNCSTISVTTLLVKRAKRMKTFVETRQWWAVRVLLITLLGGLTWTPDQTFSAWTIGDPIVTYWAGPGFMTLEAVTDANAQQMVDVGMNMCWARSQDELAVAKRHNLRALYMDETLLRPESLDDATLRPQLDALVDSLRGNSAMYAYHLVDEPSASAFSGLGRLVTYLRERDPAHMAYVNLLPNYASTTQFGTSDYSTYLDGYVSAVNPSLLSYDHYQFTTSGDTGKYLHNLQQVSQKAKSAGLPFMNIVQACSFDSGYRIPTPNEERFLAYSTMAYGAKGISYFVWYHPYFTGGIVDADDKPTAIYSTLATTNREFVNIAKQYKSLNAIGTYIKGYSTTQTWSLSKWKYVTEFNGPTGTTTLPSNSPFNITNLSDDMTYAEGDVLKGALLGLFGADGASLSDATYAMVTNLDYTSSKRYIITGPGNLSVFDAALGIWTATGSNQVTLDVLPGGGVLVGLTSVVPEPSALVLLGTCVVGLTLRAGRNEPA